MLLSEAIIAIAIALSFVFIPRISNRPRGRETSRSQQGSPFSNYQTNFGEFEMTFDFRPLILFCILFETIIRLYQVLKRIYYVPRHVKVGSRSVFVTYKFEALLHAGFALSFGALATISDGTDSEVGSMFFLSGLSAIISATAQRFSDDKDSEVSFFRSLTSLSQGKTFVSLQAIKIGQLFAFGSLSDCSKYCKVRTQIVFSFLLFFCCLEVFRLSFGWAILRVTDKPGGYMEYFAVKAMSPATIQLSYAPYSDGGGESDADDSSASSRRSLSRSSSASSSSEHESTSRSQQYEMFFFKRMNSAW
jgi:hypothetical protein